MFLSTVVFFFNDTATTEIYTYGHTLSLHDALPSFRVSPSSSQSMPGSLAAICQATTARPRTRRRPPLCPESQKMKRSQLQSPARAARGLYSSDGAPAARSEEHTSELQSLLRSSYAVFCLNQTTITSICLYTHN